MKLTDFDYYLPKELIAQQPLPQRDESRLLVLHRKSGKIEDRIFKDITEYLVPGDTLVLNDTKVFPARLFGIEACLVNGLKKVEILLSKEQENQVWEVLIKPSRKVKVGAKLQFGDELIGELIEKRGSRGLVKFEYEGNFFKILNKLGKLPLPHYIKREANEADVEQYQTVYARHRGAIAAPTAGLHFTPQLLEKIAGQGIKLAFITLHVGVGTFAPIRNEDVLEHHMEEEYYEISSQAAEIINRTKGKIVVVGTTAVRALETVIRNRKSKIENPKSKILPCSGFTDLFIYPGFDFKITDMLITNFHLPRTTLLLLVSALAGEKRILEAYQHAVNKGYRFYSYGDAMLIV
ncbi:MAG: tRNA preQ1(34) S-adenosylmethionine ribosyltransferase-isomerase QueA [bacterium]|nr:tRNA preQ1(34) S-adenosylmethionine ribosyltransferase-isomerase QueA [bacterium]